jgi:hypothetical protein
MHLEWSQQVFTSLPFPMKTAALRRVLELNRIFFEIAGLTILSGAGIVLSCHSTISASRQAELMRLDHMPSLEIGRHQADDDRDGMFETDRIVISNIGYQLDEFDVHIATFLRLTRSKYNAASDTVLVPVRQYFETYFYTGNRKGDLVTVVGYQNNASAVLFNRYLVDRSGGWRGTASFGHDLFVVAKATYRDFTGAVNQAFYEVQLINGARRLNDNQGAGIWSVWDKSLTSAGRSVTLDSIYADTIIRIGRRQQ